MKVTKRVYETSKINGVTMRQFMDGTVKIEMPRELFNWLLLTASMGLEEQETSELKFVADLLSDMAGYQRTWLNPKESLVA